MASRGDCDLLILHGSEAHEWRDYLLSLFKETKQLEGLVIENVEIISSDSIPMEYVNALENSRCIFVLLSGELLDAFCNPKILDVLQTALRPPNKVVVLFCGVTDHEDFLEFFEDWSKWKQLSSEDDSQLYVNAVIDAIAEDAENEVDSSVYDIHIESSHQPSSEENQRNLIAIQPERIRCGEKTQMYLIFKCKLDTQIKNEVYFIPINGPSVRLPATLENEYILSLDAPDLPSGQVYLKVLSGDLLVCESKITYFTDMEEISNLLLSATNPVEFMCQAFKIVPYNTERLDKLLTESLKNNIPASGLHLFGINQIEEDNLSANQRDEELPTLLHFSAKYGLKNLTALLLTCPGALQAYSVANKHGDYPNKIAENYGYKDLRQFIDEYVETADMLRTHIKEQLMPSGDEDENNTIYECMANSSTDLLMKCSLNPGELYESMTSLLPQLEMDDIYVDMLQAKKNASASSDTQGIVGDDSVIRKILEGDLFTWGHTITTGGTSYLKTGGNIDYTSDEEDPYYRCQEEDVYHIVEEGTPNIEPVCRPPVPVPRPTEPLDTEPFISKVFPDKAQARRENLYVESKCLKPLQKDPTVRLKRDRAQSSVYDPFVGMKTPGQRELITLQEQVKLQMISVDEALLQFKEWQLNQKKRSDSFRYQQENLKKLRDSINRRRNENKKKGRKSDLEITQPIRRNQNTDTKPDCAVYDSGPIFSIPQKKEIRRGNWKTDSTSSTASSASNRSSTRSTVSSGMEGDNEDNEVSEDRPPPRPPRVPNRSTRGAPSTTQSFIAPPVPPRGR
ncbi:Hypothetical predicted protein [Pelobates cultripes]|uniref:Phosphoinositide-3-kinase adaptor protein 1 n=1 Tax=Pelobates cultripes TaxID=61616 RepID=A0AAD1T9V8_PELCU|nr:Hypothetical predicted protein [Pelobates cultripes]